VDQLGYNYANGGNRLLTVTDNISSTLGFADGNKTGDDYDYYADGSLKKDLNRNITLIEYNLLKLPRRVTFTNSTTLTIQYDATGQKLRMTTTPASGTTTTRDYVGAFQYLNNNLFEISHPEGRYSPTGGYEFFHKDHLGNVRAVTSQTTTAAGALTAVLTQYTDYDPWGLPLWGALSGGNSTNRSTFLGREYQSELGYQDLQHRFYDPTIGRFTTIDPLPDVGGQESWSPFHYSFNNPIRFSDPTGLVGCCGGSINDPYLFARLIATKFYDTKHAIENTLLRAVGSEKRVRYKSENGQEVFSTEIYTPVPDNSLGGYIREGANTITDLALIGSASGGNSADILSARSSSNNQIARIATNAADGAAREAAEAIELSRQYPNATVQRESYLRGSDGKRAVDPLTGEARRIDHVVIENNQVVKMVETTSMTAPKAAQIAKEQRIREAGGTYIRNRQDRQLLNVTDIITELSRRQ
jgi:RHS repeat-associated protein